MAELRHHGDDGGAHHRACSCGDCAACRAFEQWRTQFQARMRLADKQARLHATEVRSGAQARRLLRDIRDTWYDEIDLEIVHVEGES